VSGRGLAASTVQVATCRPSRSELERELGWLWSPASVREVSNGGGGGHLATGYCAVAYCVASWELMRARRADFAAACDLCNSRQPLALSSQSRYNRVVLQLEVDGDSAEFSFSQPGSVLQLAWCCKYVSIFA